MEERTEIKSLLEDSHYKPDIVGDIFRTKGQEAKVYPAHSNWASQIGGECLRELVYMRTAWEQKTLPSTTLMFIFDGGKIIEPYAIRTIEEAGYQILEQQRHFKVNERSENITGRLDLKVGFNGTAYPCEVKGLSKWTWDVLNNIEDFFSSKYSYVRKYPAQLLMYMYATSSDDGFFYLVNKANFQPKVIWMHLEDHIDYVQSLLDKAIEVNKHVEAETLPERCTNQELCERCDYEHVCCPPMEFEGKVIIDDELEQMLDQREALLEQIKEPQKEYNSVDKAIKALVKGKELICGSFRVGGKWIEKEMPAKEAHIQRYWRCSIKKL